MKNPFLSALALLLISACSNGDQTIHEMDELVEENVGEPRTDLEGLNLPTVPYNYSAIDLPAHFTATEVLQADNTPANNPVQDEGATLGRVLFYDKAMSLNNSTSCASCHTQQSG
ncbi:MAG: cytochrome c peroxidase, partial [Bacteroidota bacterium]